MKIFRVQIVLFFFVFYMTVSSQWQPLINGPTGANTFSITEFNDQLFITSDKGIFVSSNYVTWNYVNFEPNLLTLTPCYIAATDTFIVANRGEFVKISYDSGINWEDISFGLANKSPEMLLANDSTIIAKTGGSLFIKEKTNGFWNVWKEIWTPSNNINVISVAFNNSSIIFTSNSNEIYKSTNQGVTWNITPFDSTISLYSIKCYKNNYYLCTYNGLFKSTDNGETWTSALSSYYVKNFYMNDVFAIAQVYSSPKDKLLILFDDLNVFTELSDDYYDRSITDFLIKDNSCFLTTSLGGVFRHYLNGFGWDAISFDLIPFNINSFTYNDNYLFAYTNMSEGVFRSSDDGRNWIYSPLPHYNPNVFPNLSNLLVKRNIIIGTEATNSYSYYSTTNGSNWTTIDWGGANRSTTVLGNDLYSAGFQVTKWNENTTPYIFTTSPINLQSIAVMGDSSNYKIVVSTLNNELYISDEQLNNWTNISLNLPNSITHINDISVTQNSIYVAITNSSVNQTGVYKSTDFGNTWIQIINNRYIEKLFSKDNYVFAAASSFNGGIFASKNSGNSFVPFNEGLDLLNFYDIKQFQITDDYVYIGLNSEYLIKCTSGIWKRKLSEIIVDVKTETNPPLYFNLGQNYPNPFNPTTQINFSLPHGSFVSLKIYDVLGKEITTLVNEELPAGNYTKSFDASNYSSGIYLYKISTEKFNETKKMVLLK